jgi:hypothetical protein
MKATSSNRHIPISGARRIPAISRKAVIAIGLIIVMLFMWIRLFMSGESGPDKASGGSISPVPLSVFGPSDTALTRIELPIVAGRNDDISNEMFTKDGWDGSEGKKVTVETNSGADLDLKSQETRIRELAGSLHLGAIIEGGDVKGYEAFIDGELISVGSKLPVSQEGRTYEFTVVNVLKDRVILKWKEFTIAIKMF